MSWCDDLSDEGLAQLCVNLPHLKELRLRRCAVASCTLSALARGGYSQLRTLNLSSALPYLLSDGHVVEMSRSLAALRVIDISWNSGISNEGVSALLSNCPLIENCCLDGLKLVTAEPFWPMVVRWSVNQATAVAWTEELQERVERGLVSLMWMFTCLDVEESKRGRERERERERERGNECCCMNGIIVIENLKRENGQGFEGKLPGCLSNG